MQTMQDRERHGARGGAGRLRAMSNQSPILDATIARLAQEHDAPTLAAALVARLRADGRADGATALVATLDDQGIIIAGPPNPHSPVA
jgi:hypothetical protein